MNVKKSELSNPAFREGMKVAIEDRKRGMNRVEQVLASSGEDSDFYRGYAAIMDYQQIRPDSWWDRVNDKLTKFAADVGTTFFTKR